MEPNKSKKSKSKPVFIAAICLGAAMMVVAGVFLGVWLSGGEVESVEVVDARERGHVSARGVVVTEDNIDEFLEQQPRDTRFNSYRTRMTNEWVFSLSTGTSYNVHVENHPNNAGTVFFDLVLDGEIIYSSPYIPLGERVDSIAIDADVPPGEHSPVVVYHLVDEYYAVRSTLSVGITLHVTE
jgi:hypothetical protein